MGNKYKKNSIGYCGKSVVPGFKNLVIEKQEIEKVLIFSDFREYHFFFLICLTISLGILSMFVIIPFICVITSQTLNTVLNKQLGQFYLLQLIIIQYSIAVTKEGVECSGWVVFIPLISSLELLFWIQSMVSLNLKWVQNKMKKLKVNNLLR